MEDLQTILDRVLAGVGEMVAERKVCGSASLSCFHDPASAGPRAGQEDAFLEPEARSPQAKGPTQGILAGGTGGQCFKSSADAFTADHSLPAQRVTGPKSTAGGKRLRVLKLCSCSDGVHDRIAHAPKPQAHPKRIS